MKSSLKQRVLDPFLDFIFPKLCFHCSEKMASENFLLCSSCFTFLELIDPLSSCPRCFSSAYDRGTSFCSVCHNKSSFLTAMASALDYEGPAETLIKKFKYHDRPYLAESLASFMVMQLFELKWPLPDCIIPVPISQVRLICRGYNQSLLLAKEIGRLLNKPVIEALGRKSGDFSQASLGYHQRLKMEGDSLFLKRNMDLQDKKVLLIDDVLTTGTTLRRCAEVLIESCPHHIYGMTVCRSNSI